jgi:methyl-accepting chemotaxis protein
MRMKQMPGIEQISKMVIDLDQIVQSNASSAEETASASEEMSAQSKAMKESVIEFVSLVGSEGNYVQRIPVAVSAPAERKPPEKKSTAPKKKSLPAPVPRKDF